MFERISQLTDTQKFSLIFGGGILFMMIMIVLFCVFAINDQQTFRSDYDERN